MSDYKPDIHKELYEVSTAGDCARVRELLEAGADPEKYKDRDGWTALHRAAGRGHNEVVKTLIQAKCDLNLKNEYGYTALHWAARYGRNEVVKTLIQAKCDLNLKNKDGFTALHWAAVNGRTNVVVSLLESGADPCLTRILEMEYSEMKYYISIIHWCISQGHYEVFLKFLEKVPSLRKKGKIVAMLMTKDPSRISSLMNFLSKMSEKIEDKDKKEESDRIRKIFSDMFGMFDQDKIFYLVRCPEFDGKSLLSYINSQNVRLFRQGEELSVMIANMKN